ncbi:MAG: hypothetical protein ACRCUM_03805, partial [Mycoplasmoidaceae bacterium]
VSIDGGAYYDSNNKGLPSNTSNPPLILSVPITGIKAIPDTGTLVIPRTGTFPGVFPALIDENNITEFFTIENQIPGSTFTIDITSRSDDSTPEESFDGTITFKIKFDKEYETDGRINIDPVEKEYIITGLQGGAAPKFTTTFQTGNTDLFSNTLAAEINESNINQFISIVNLPNDVNPIYEFTNQKNTGQENTGFQEGKITISKFINELGNEVNRELLIPFKINNLKTIPDVTSVTPLSGNEDMLPELVNEVDLEKYLRINNGSPIFNKETSIQIVADKLKSSNINGTITFEYRLINAITNSGIIEKSNPILVTISGFKKGNFTGVERVVNNINQKASEFDLNKDNFFKYAKIVGHYVPLNVDYNGNIISGTVINKVEKISFNDSTGVATFKLTLQGGAINEEESFSINPLEIIFDFDGFQIVKSLNNIPIIAGSITGGIFLIIAIVVLIIINNIRNKKILNAKRKTIIPSSPPVNLRLNKLVVPSEKTNTNDILMTPPEVTRLFGPLPHIVNSRPQVNKQIKPSNIVTNRPQVNKQIKPSNIVTNRQQVNKQIKPSNIVNTRQQVNKQIRPSNIFNTRPQVNKQIRHSNIVNTRPQVNKQIRHSNIVNTRPQVNKQIKPQYVKIARPQFNKQFKSLNVATSKPSVRSSQKTSPILPKNN